MDKRSEVIEIIFKSVEETNQQEGTAIPKDVNARLFGKESNLDSLGLVNLIVNIEEQVNSKYDSAISIVDEKAMSQNHSPFRTVSSLADHIMVLLGEK